MGLATSRSWVWFPHNAWPDVLHMQCKSHWRKASAKCIERKINHNIFLILTTPWNWVCGFYPAKNKCSKSIFLTFPFIYEKVILSFSLNIQNIQFLKCNKKFFLFLWAKGHNFENFRLLERYLWMCFKHSETSLTFENVRWTPKQKN